MDDKIINLNVLFLSLNNIFEMLYSIYIPTINAVETRLNMLITPPAVGEAES